MAFDFANKTLTLQGQEAPIAEFVVEFMTPWGCFSTLEEAIQKVAQLDMDPTLIINPVIVIRDLAGRSEMFLRNK
jgi:hypothetical protein